MKVVKKGKNKKERHNVKQTRKQIRKEKRKEKKVRRNEYYQNGRNRNNKTGTYVLAPKELSDSDDESNKQPQQEQKQKSSTKSNTVTMTNIVTKEKKEQKSLQNEMRKQRKRQLVEANNAEEKNIKKLEKQLKMNKRKTKGVPHTFATDGLDYLLEVCDLDRHQGNETEQAYLMEGNDEEFGEDLALVMNKANNSNTNKQQIMEEDSEIEENYESDIDSCLNSISEEEHEDLDDDDAVSLLGESLHFEATVDEVGETYEDIYGRLRDKKSGAVIKGDSPPSKYIPPALRGTSTDDTDNHSEQVTKAAEEKLNRLRKVLKGLLNRLAESNMHGISKQIEELYMQNSRNDMNATLTNLILDACVQEVLSPERLLIEHVMLVVVLHANVGTEVGAHFMQKVIKQFDDAFVATAATADKTLDNLTLILAQLYNFKMYSAPLLYEILRRLCENFDEKCVECILHVLKSVGFGLRKDDPVALKTFIFDVQKRATSVVNADDEDARVKFLLDILLAIKNNNVTKIPNYDTAYPEHCKKLLKGLLRKGNYVTELNLSLADLMNAEQKGKWWIVGSAWSGNEQSAQSSKITATTAHDNVPTNNFSEKLLSLARKQRMNTDTRRDIFCILMSAEDYMDAFEKLLHLGLKGQQHREIVNVLLHCCLQERDYNPYYAVLAQKLCDHDRKYQMAVKFAVWDKLKMLASATTKSATIDATQIANLAKLLTHLFLEKGLPISTLKIVQFGELDKVTLRFVRQILLGVLLHDDATVCVGVFEKVALSAKLKTFRDSLRLFVHHFLLKNLTAETIANDKRAMIEERAHVVEKVLSANEKMNVF